jgi:hypothetical protein
VPESAGAFVEPPRSNVRRRDGLDAGGGYLAGARVSAKGQAW